MLVYLPEMLPLLLWAMNSFIKSDLMVTLCVGVPCRAYPNHKYNIADVDHSDLLVTYLTCLVHPVDGA